MRTAEARAREWWKKQQWLTNDEAVIASLERLLDEERKRARHGCAEALAGVSKSIDESNRAVIDYDEAHEAIMNARTT